MGSIPFAKYHGLGNDFILLDFRAGGTLTSAQAIRLCDRRRGIGADGVLSLLPSRDGKAQFRMHVFNSDGSEAEMCGNGLRCAVAFAGLDQVQVDTDAGRLGGWMKEAGVRISLGAPTSKGRLVVESAGERFAGLVVSVGNPHFVLGPFEESESLLERARTIGPALSTHSAFERGTNVELYRKEGDAIRLVVFERGAGLTEACGTGAAATVLAAEEADVVDKGIAHRVLLPGGPLTVEIERDESGTPTCAYLTGEAVKVFEGTVEI